MTKHPIEVITSVERRRRWSREDKERLVAACLEPGAVLSEIAHAAGIHVSQLFRWRKELCRIEEASTQVSSTLVPVIVSETAPAAQSAASEAPGSPHPRRKRSDVTIDLGRGRRVRVDSDIDTEAAFSIVCWVGDDPGSCWCEGLVGDWPYGHAQGLSRSVADGARDTEA
ncbi:transposase [Rhizobium sp. R339]|uniref:IS66-like element accessory protein TnpA n=1 Tax=Rhizobium sp. R339 TaxID=1764273 RepID=UPI001131E726|nr:transposase [Rhizobium sp. R339]